jgi:signal transduction histidine kinase
MIAWIAAAVGLCLAGLLAVQVLLIRQNFEWRRQAFRQDVHGALAGAVEKLEARETLKRIWTLSFFKKGRNDVSAVLRDESDPALFVLPGRFVPKVQADGGDIVLTLSVAQRVRLVVVEPVGLEDRTVLDETFPAGRSVVPVARLAPGAEGPGRPNWVKLLLDDVQYDLTLDKGQVAGILVHPTVDQSRAALIDGILEDYVVVDPVPVERRVEPEELRTAVDEALRERGISLACAYGVIPAGRQEVILASDDRWKPDLLKSEFRARLFPDELSVAPADLAFFFPEREGSPLARLGAPAAIALVLVAAAALCLLIVLRAVAAQKRYAAVLTDFVNNMTHEFKTPISTISLACDALGQGPVRADLDRQSKYRDMIQSECGRMKGQVRKILEAAALEKGDLDLRIERLDAHEAIREAAAAVGMALGGRGGSIETRLEAAGSVIEADPVHFRNVLANLLDNAVQYAQRRPEIVVTTEDAGGRLRIAVADNGIGLSPEDQKRVFERYYRVPTGNVHDVKGFGIGLSYVKLIVKAHGGKAGVRSALGKGSTFTVEFPLSRGGANNKGRRGGA